MKASALRLADSFLIISKTSKEVSIGMISKELQKKLDDKNRDFILTPIINYKIENDKDKEKEKKEGNNKYIAKSNYPLE